MGKRLEEILTQEHMQMTNKHMKNTPSYSSSGRWELKSQQNPVLYPLE